LRSGASAAASGPEGSSPYAWGFTTVSIPLSASLGYADFSSRGFVPNTTKGFGFALSYDGEINGNALSFPIGSATFLGRLRFPVVNLGLNAWASVAAHPQAAVGPRGGASLQSYREYADLYGNDAPYYIYAQAQAGYEFKTKAEIIPRLYVESIDALGGYRAAFDPGPSAAANPYLDSIFILMGFDLRLGGLGVASQLPFFAGMEVSYALKRSDSRIISLAPYLSLGSIF
jgi:hypothetical protein